jgi:hypothetical protein
MNIREICFQGNNESKERFVYVTVLQTESAVHLDDDRKWLFFS